MEWYEELYQTDAWRKESTLARFRLDGKKAFITGGAGGFRYIIINRSKPAMYLSASVATYLFLITLQKNAQNGLLI